MNYRELRIAWSVGWGLVAVLLCALWVRSYWWADALWYRPSKGIAIRVLCDEGGITFLKASALRLGTMGDAPALGWSHR